MIGLHLAVPKTALACETEVADELSMDLEISALYPNPNAGESEWIELRNLGTSPIDLSLYTLEDSTAKPWTPSGTLEESKVIEGFSFQLNNSNETVTLKTMHGEVVDSFSYASSEKGVILYTDTTAEVSTEAVAEVPTETETPESTPTPSTTPTLWPIFSEALPNPEGSDSTEEWIELYNPHGETLVLNGLFLDDSEGGSTPHGLTGSLAAESYLVLSVTESGLTLNNDSDSVRLLGVNQEVLWDIPYTGSQEGLSTAWFGDFYDWTEELTPGSENLLSSAQESSESTEETEESPYQDGDLSDQVELSEIFPNPEGPDAEEEWIELTNGGSEPVNLGNWILDDGEGGSEPFTLPDSTILEPGQTLILYRTETGIALNNSNETVQLSDFTGEIVSEIQYESSEEDQSYSEIQIEEVQSVQASASGLGQSRFSTWQWVTPSPGALNPVWKQIKGEVMEFDGSLLTLFDGVSTWSFKLTEQEAVDDLLYQSGNTLLVQASAQNGIYQVMHSELLETAAAGTKTHSFPWGFLISASLATAWIGHERYKRRKSWHLGAKVLN